MTEESEVCKRNYSSLKLDSDEPADERSKVDLVYLNENLGVRGDQNA